MANTYIPYGSRVVVRSDPPADKSTGGIYIPDYAVEKASSRGTVMAVGLGELREDGTRDPMPFADGDVVFFQKGVGMGLVEGDSKTLILDVKEIVGIDEASLAG